MKELLKKVTDAKIEIKSTKLKKEGRNTFSNYDYFTPDQIEYLVALACKNNNLLTTFDLIRNELGIYGMLTIYDVDGEDSLKLQMATDIPIIKATNTAQQLGGCVTYTERYLKMSAFGITDNQLDFDTTKNTKNHNATEEPKEPVKGLTYQQKLNEIDAIFEEGEISHEDIAHEMECAWVDLYNVTEKAKQNAVIKFLVSKITKGKK